MANGRDQALRCHLEKIGFDGSQYTGSELIDLFENMPHLKILSLGQCKNIHTPSVIGFTHHLEQLVSLYSRGSNVSGLLPFTRNLINLAIRTASKSKMNLLPDSLPALQHAEFTTVSTENITKLFEAAPHLKTFKTTIWKSEKALLLLPGPFNHEVQQCL